MAAENEETLHTMVIFGQLMIPPAAMCLLMGARGCRHAAGRIVGVATRAIGDRTFGHGSMGAVGDRRKLGDGRDTFKVIDVTGEFDTRTDLRELGDICRKMGVGFHILEDGRSGRLGIEYTARDAETLEFALGTLLARRMTAESVEQEIGDAVGPRRETLSAPIALPEGNGPFGALGPGEVPAGLLPEGRPVRFTKGGITWERADGPVRGRHAKRFLEDAAYRASFPGPCHDGREVFASLAANGSWSIREADGAPLKMFGQPATGRAPKELGHTVDGAAVTVGAVRACWCREVMRHHAARLRSPATSRRMTSARLMSSAARAGAERSRSARNRARAAAPKPVRMRRAGRS